MKEPITASELPPEKRLWPEENEVLYPLEAETLNWIASSILGKPVDLPLEFWEAVVDLYQKGHKMPFGKEWIPERVAKHIVLSLGEAAPDPEEAWKNAKNNPQQLIGSVVGKSHAQRLKAQAFGREYDNLVKETQRLAKAAASPPNPPDQKPQASIQGASKQTSPAPPQPPQPPSKTEGPKPGEATSSPPTHYPELQRAYKSGVFATLVQKVVGKTLEDLEKRLQHLEKAPAAEESLQRRVQALEEKLNLAEKELAEIKKGLAETKENLARTKEELEKLLEEALQTKEYAQQPTSPPHEDLEAFKAGIRRVIRVLASSVAELQALAFGPSGRPPLLPEEAINLLEDTAKEKKADLQNFQRWLSPKRHG